MALPRAMTAMTTPERSGVRAIWRRAKRTSRAIMARLVVEEV
jgi:hypothetical protein